MAIFTKVTYQGVPCQAVSYKRSPWFEPEAGYVDVLARDIKQIKVEVDDIPWEGINDEEIEGQLSITAWNRLRPTVSPGRARARGQDAPAGGGFRHFGDLVMESFDGTSALSDEMRYNWVYVDSSGLEEITRDLADVKAHASGKVRVPLTDIRRYFKKHGALVCRINARSKAGYWDRASLNEDKPWTAQQVITYLFSQLPGSPAPSFAPDVTTATLEGIPENIVGLGDPVIEILEDLLKKHGLVPMMLPDGNFRVSIKGSKLVKDNEIAFDLGQYGLYEHQHYETRSVYVTDRPPMVQVFGKPVIRRITRTYIPAIQDTDGTIFKLSDLPVRWGYPVSAVNAQVFNDEHRFVDLQIPERIEILERCAYKMYVPADAFPVVAAAGGGGSAVAEVVGITTEDLERQPFLPVKAAPVYASDLNEILVGPPIDDGLPDRARYALMEPLVYGNRVSQGFFEDFGKVEDHFQRVVGPAQTLVSYLTAIETQLARLQDQYGDQVQKIVNDSVVVLGTSGNPLAGTAELRTATKLLQILTDSVTLESRLKIAQDADVGRALSRMKLLVDHPQALKLAYEDTFEQAQAAQKLFTMRTAIATMIQQTQAVVSGWNAKLSTFKNAHEKVGGIQAKMNMPWGLLPEGSYTLDKDTGILWSQDPLCHMTTPFMLDDGAAEVGSDGGIVVTAGYEVYDNHNGGLTSILLSVSDLQDGTPQVEIVGACRSSPIKAKIARSPHMRLYQADLGTPMNLHECEAQAVGAAAGELAVPKAIEGKTYTLSGLVLAMLDGGTSTVQHQWDADSKRPAYTYVAVNAPFCRAPVAPAEAEPPITPLWEIREIEQINHDGV